MSSRSADGNPWNASNEGIYSSSAACCQAEARVEENYNVQWAGCEANPAGTWTLWVVW